jgi:hypothetical protein
MDVERRLPHRISSGLETCTSLAASADGARRLAFFRDRQSLVILGGEIGHKNFWLLDLRTGAQRILAELPADFVVRDFDISAAGSEIVFDRVQATSDLALIERAH